MFIAEDKDAYYLPAFLAIRGRDLHSGYPLVTRGYLSPNIDPSVLLRV